ncbi:MAG: hypothetical protein HXS51_08850 [Theionarchaea archaeon]|nr:hypothetical protein [Theionarchaea archaeon]
MGSNERGTGEVGNRESFPETMVFVLETVSKYKRLPSKMLLLVAKNLEPSTLRRAASVLERGGYLRKRRESDDTYYSLASQGDILMEKEREKIKLKLKDLLAKMKPRAWERRLYILQIVQERREATFTEISEAVKDQFPIGSSRANMYRDIEQLRMKEYLVISKFSTVYENLYEVGDMGIKVLEKRGQAFEREPSDLPLVTTSSTSREQWASIGDIAVPWIIVEGTGEFMYTKEHIVSRYLDLPLDLPSDLEALATREKAAVARREKKKGGTIWDAKKYRLMSFHKTRFPDPVTDEEVPGMYLEFGPTRYSVHLALERNLDTPGIVYDERGQPTSIRKKYLDPVWNPLRPNPLLSNSFGVNLLVVCQDNAIIVVLRNLTEVEKGKGVHNLSIDEGMSRPLDEETPGVPSVFKCAKRGLDEELGLVVSSDKVEFFSLGIDPLRHEYGILGIVEPDLTSREVVNQFKARAKDRFEVERTPLVVPFDPHSVFEFMQSNKPWTPWAIMGLYQTLIRYFGFEKTQRMAKGILTEEGLWA